LQPTNAKDINRAKRNLIGKIYELTPVNIIAEIKFTKIRSKGISADRGMRRKALSIRVTSPLWAMPPDT
jgi:hypothetical protein